MLVILIHTLEALVVETDLVLLFGANVAGCDSLPSDEGNRGVPGGVRSLLTIDAISIMECQLTKLISNPCYSRS